MFFLTHYEFPKNIYEKVPETFSKLKTQARQRIYPWVTLLVNQSNQ